ncbi:arsenate reductase/protein-tyrosine-phosphatase family protein [Klenkia brasiliensis]|uniref:Protein-tyrosine phosphatase n=1 Tax=Klenkia brasiliensis TaxID=333142 RepID=A0A1G7MSY0_9ACTN|nr:hypothetical protein [Klenkia brasiliensis]SDF64771.1 protein-tyrosine phosphatase [Klenkia brasiliensis]
MRIVFVCTTNVWGSAMADLMARSLLAQWDPDRNLIQIESVGVRPQIGAVIPAPAQRVLAGLGLRAENHRARWMTSEVLDHADLVLTMGAIQRDAALALHPLRLRSTFTLLEAARLCDALQVEVPLAPEFEAHARAFVAGMASLRRFHRAFDGSDDLPDLIGNEADIVAVAEQIQACVARILRSLVQPYAKTGTEAPGVQPTATAVA